MTSDEACQGELGVRPHARVSPCKSTTPAGRDGLCAQRYAWGDVPPDCPCSNKAEALLRRDTGCVSNPEEAGGNERWITSYVRTRMRSIAGEAFSISRHTTDCVAKALHEQFLLDSEAVLQRILDFAALRCLYEGASTTVTLDDVRVGLCSAASPPR